MIISRTPFRISFFGGGTDYPVWYEKHGGCVLAATINRYCYISCRYLPPFFKHRHRIVYSQIEMTRTVDEIKHPVVKEGIRFLNFSDGLEIHHDGDLPARTGIGSSSSFTVGLLHSLHALRGERATPMQLAREAIHIERDLCRENVGSQDQLLAAYGGVNHIRFQPGDIITVQPITVSADRLDLLQRHLMLFFTGFSRLATEVAAEQIKNTPRKESELSAMQAMVDEGMNILSSNEDIHSFGKLLHEGWQLKRTLSSRISNDNIDAIYDKALKAGAIGGKLCGAGGGGFLLLFVEPDRQAVLVDALKGYLHVPFEFDWLGSQIIFYQPERARGIAADHANG